LKGSTKAKVIFGHIGQLCYKQVSMKVSDRVRVTESVLVYHHPQHKKVAFDVQGLEGDVVAILTEWQGRPISANLPILVQFEGRFKAHFRESEVTVVE
jgi:hypothetical protein